MRRGPPAFRSRAETEAAALPCFSGTLPVSRLNILSRNRLALDGAAGSSIAAGSSGGSPIGLTFKLYIQ